MRHFHITLRGIDKEAEPTGYLAQITLGSIGAKCDILPCWKNEAGTITYGENVPLRKDGKPADGKAIASGRAQLRRIE